jgi:hypothetical protein
MLRHANHDNWLEQSIMSLLQSGDANIASNRNDANPARVSPRTKSDANENREAGLRTGETGSGAAHSGGSPCGSRKHGSPASPDMAT